MGKMTSKEFNLLITLVIELLKAGKTDEVIRILEDAKENNNAKPERK